MTGSTVQKKVDPKVRRNEIEARKMRLAVKVAERNARKRAGRLFLVGPAARHLMKMERSKLRTLRVLAMIEANLFYKRDFLDSLRDFAWERLYLQREASLRKLARYEAACGTSFTKLFDIRYHLSTPGGVSFNDATAYYPLRPVAEQPYWEPVWNPYRPLEVTDGSMVVGDLRIYEKEERFQPISAELFEREYPWDSRILAGPIGAFLRMRCTSGESASDGADQAVPDKAIKGKKHPRRPTSRSAVKAKNKKEKATAAGNAKKAASTNPSLSANQASPPVSGFVDYFDYGDAAPSYSWDYADPNAPPSTGAKKEKPPTFAPYVEYDDPTLPTPEDLAEEKRKDWNERYIRGETLYGWTDGSLTDTLSSNLYFEQSPSLRSTSEFVISDTSSTSSVYFDSVPAAQGTNGQDFSHLSSSPSNASPLYFDPSTLPTHTSSFTSSDASWMSLANTATDIFFSESDISRFDQDDLESLVSSCEDSIYYDHLSVTSSQTAADQSWFGLEEVAEGDRSSDLYFSLSSTSILSPLASQLSKPSEFISDAPDISIDITSMPQSAFHYEKPASLSMFGNPSLAFEIVQ
jgi:hypothetical protein